MRCIHATPSLPLSPSVLNFAIDVVIVVESVDRLHPNGVACLQMAEADCYSIDCIVWGITLCCVLRPREHCLVFVLVVYRVDTILLPVSMGLLHGHHGHHDHGSATTNWYCSIQDKVRPITHYKDKLADSSSLLSLVPRSHKRDTPLPPHTHTQRGTICVLQHVFSPEHHPVLNWSPLQSSTEFFF